MLVSVSSISGPNFMLVSKSAQFAWNFELCRRTVRETASPREKLSKQYVWYCLHTAYNKKLNKFHLNGHTRISFASSIAWIAVAGAWEKLGRARSVGNAGGARRLARVPRASRSPQHRAPYIDYITQTSELRRKSESHCMTQNLTQEWKGQAGHGYKSIFITCISCLLWHAR